MSEGSTGEGVPRTQQKEERDEEEDNYDDNEDEEEDEEEGEGEGEEEEEDEEDEEREVEEVKGQVFSGFSFGVPRPDIKVAQNVVGGQNTAQPLTGTRVCSIMATIMCTNVHRQVSPSLRLVDCRSQRGV